jgi:hypothetical protein
VLTYGPSLTSLMTTISERSARAVVDSPESRARLERLLQELGQLAAAGSLSLQQRLMVHTTAWEIVFGLQRIGEQNAGLAPSLRGAVDAGLRVLRATQFSPALVARLPSTLGQLPRLAGAPEIATTVDRLLRHDPELMEVLLPTELHADILVGRFTPRLFLTVTDKNHLARFNAYLADPATPYWTLKKLPATFPGLQAILVLYFNVLTPGLTVTPTEQVAFWQQYTFTGTTPSEVPFSEAIKNIHFLTIAFARTLRAGPGSGDGTGALRYRKVEQDAMTRRGFLDVKPAVAGERVTSLRGHCLRCHMYQVATFDTHGAREVRFVPPLVKGGRDLLTPFFLENVETKLREWARSSPTVSATEGSPGPHR